MAKTNVLQKALLLHFESMLGMDLEDFTEFLIAYVKLKNRKETCRLLQDISEFVKYGALDNDNS